MKLSEAYKILGLNENASEEEVKKSFKKMAAEKHPDVKLTGNEEEFKKINEAYNTIKNPPSQNQFPEDFAGRPFVNIEDIFAQHFAGAGFTFNQVGFTQIMPDININILLSYKEFVLGCTKNLTFKRLDKNKKEESIIIDLKIPAFASKMRIKGKGHFVQRRPNVGETYTDAYVNMVVKDNEFIVNGQTLVINKTVSLKDAVFGKQIELDLIFIKLNVSLPEMTKNKDIIQFNMNNSYFNTVSIIWNVEYPSNIKEIV